MPDSLRGDLDAEVAACKMGADRIADLFRRYGKEQVEACFEAILARTTETFRRELLSKIPEGTFIWEDYAEHDGVDPPRLHTQRMTLTKADERLVIDFSGTSPQAKGPINHAGNYADGVFLKKWIAPILRNLADTPERPQISLTASLGNGDGFARTLKRAGAVLDLFTTDDIGVTRLEPGSIISADPSTASNAPAGIRFSSLMSWSLHADEVWPLKNQFDPLSARISP